VIPKSFIQDLLNRLDIVDVIERYVPLKKSGANYAACCPFHNEKSPSFTVSQSKQFYHCFGCGAHGTAISFVMEHAGMGFIDAVEELSRSIGVEVPRETPTPGQVQHKVAPDLYDLMQAVTRYYREQLKQSPRAIEYLKQRGLSGEIAARFGIGYAPDAWQNLTGVTTSYQDASLVDTGMVIEGDSGKRYDRFRDRIMFPIVNARGQVIGFGGRILDSGEPKYLNSPETVLFEKGHELYGLFQAQKAIRAHQQVVVVEVIWTWWHWPSTRLSMPWRHSVQRRHLSMCKNCCAWRSRSYFVLMVMPQGNAQHGVPWKIRFHTWWMANVSVFCFYPKSTIQTVIYASRVQKHLNSCYTIRCHFPDIYYANYLLKWIYVRKKGGVICWNRPNHY
jgi:hypothetical protein